MKIPFNDLERIYMLAKANSISEAKNLTRTIEIHQQDGEWIAAHEDNKCFYSNMARSNVPLVCEPINLEKPKGYDACGM